MSDEIRNRIRNLDPMSPGVPISSPTHEQMENIMTNEPLGTSQTKTPRWYVAAAAVAAAAVLAVAIPALNGNTTDTTVVEAAPLQLSLGDGLAMQSCIVFDVDILAEMETAFEGTVTSIEDEMVTLAIDQWYTDGDAAVVELRAPSGLQALTGGIDFTLESQYLITAAGSTVNYCGYSGPSTPEFRAAFDEAFAG